MADSTPIQWQNADFLWNDNPYKWNEVILVLSVESAGQAELDALDDKKKKRLIKLIMRLDGVKIYDEFKEPNKGKLTVKNVELLVEDVKATIRGFKHETE